MGMQPFRESRRYAAAAGLAGFLTVAAPGNAAAGADCRSGHQFGSFRPVDAACGLLAPSPVALLFHRLGFVLEFDDRTPRPLGLSIRLGPGFRLGARGEYDAGSCEIRAIVALRLEF